MDDMIRDWWLIPVGVAAALGVIWLVLAITLWLTKPDDVGIRDLLRLLPDVLRLLKRLAVDPGMPASVRVGLVALLAFIGLLLPGLSAPPFGASALMLAAGVLLLDEDRKSVV